MAVVTATGWKVDGMPLGVVDAPHLDQGPPANKVTHAGLKEFLKTNVLHGTVNMAPGDVVHVSSAHAMVFYSSPTPAIEPRQLRVLKDKALAYVNVARNALGHEPLTDLPKGMIGNAANCVVAQAIPEATSVGGGIGFINERAAEKVGQTWGVDIIGSAVRTPQALCAFINYFDAHAYPELAL